MQPQFTSPVTGTVLTIRQVDVPSRERTDGHRGYDGFSYVEATVASRDCVLDGERCQDLLVYQVVRVNVDHPLLAELVPGVHVTLMCTDFVDVYRSNGKLNNKPGKRLAYVEGLIRQPAKAAA